MDNLLHLQNQTTKYQLVPQTNGHIQVQTRQRNQRVQQVQLVQIQIHKTWETWINYFHKSFDQHFSRSEKNWFECKAMETIQIGRKRWTEERHE
jgi:hypothetical protein